MRLRYCGLVNSSRQLLLPAATIGLREASNSGSGPGLNRWQRSSYSAITRSASAWCPCASSQRGLSGSSHHSSGKRMTISTAALTHRNSCHWLGIHAKASRLTPTATSAVTPCEDSSTLFRASGETISERYTACVATIPPTPSVLTTESATIGQKSVT